MAPQAAYRFCTCIVMDPYNFSFVDNNSDDKNITYYITYVNHTHSMLFECLDFILHNFYLNQSWVRINCVIPNWCIMPLVYDQQSYFSFMRYKTSPITTLIYVDHIYSMLFECLDFINI